MWPSLFQVCVCVCVCTCHVAQMKRTISSDTLQLHFPSDRVNCSLMLYLLDWLVSIWGFSSVYITSHCRSECWDYRCALWVWLCMGSGDENSGPQTCVASDVTHCLISANPMWCFDICVHYIRCKWLNLLISSSIYHFSVVKTLKMTAVKNTCCSSREPESLSSTILSGSQLPVIPSP